MSDTPPKDVLRDSLKVLVVDDEQLAR